MQAALFDAPVASHDHGCKVLIRIPAEWKVEAEFGGEGDCYRPKLMHRWGDGPMAYIGMTNPSGAGLRVGDQTVMKTSRIFRRLGFGGQWIGNSCDYRHVSPRALVEAAKRGVNPVSQRNIPAILEMASQSELVVIAHGRLPGGLQFHAEAMCKALLEAGHVLHVLRLTNNGTPMHPLARGNAFIPEDVKPVRWRGPGDPS